MSPTTLEDGVTLTTITEHLVHVGGSAPPRASGLPAKARC
jgi:hypothetical protein